MQARTFIIRRFTNLYHALIRLNTSILRLYPVIFLLLFGLHKQVSTIISLLSALVSVFCGPPSVCAASVGLHSSMLYTRTKMNVIVRPLQKKKMSVICMFMYFVSGVVTVIIIICLLVMAYVHSRCVLPKGMY